MKDISKYLISSDATILQAIEKLDCLSKNDTLTLLVICDDNIMCGTITDGDVRRGFMKGYNLTDKIENIMNTSFTYFQEGVFDIEVNKKIKEKGFKIIPVLDSNLRIIDILNFQKNKTFLPIDAVLMAGGKGERLRPLTEKTPKPLLKVGEKCIIDYNIENLINHGIDNIHVTVNYLGEQIENHFSEPIKDTKINCVYEPEFLGTIGSVKFVEDFRNDTVIVMNSDLFTNLDIEDFFIHFMENEADMSIAAVPYSISIPYAIFDLEGREIKGLKEKPTFHYYANAGIYIIKRALLDLIPDGKFFHATDFMELLISKNKKVIRFPHSGYWIDIGKHEDFKKVQDFAKHIKHV